MDWRRVLLVAGVPLALAPDGCGAVYEVEVTLHNDWTENIHLYVLDSAGGGVSEGKASGNRVSPSDSRTVRLEYDLPGSYDLILRAGRDGLTDTDQTCIVDLPEPDTDGAKYEITVEAIWAPGWTTCTVDIVPR